MVTLLRGTYPYYPQSISSTAKTSIGIKPDIHEKFRSIVGTSGRSRQRLIRLFVRRLDPIPELQTQIRELKPERFHSKITRAKEKSSSAAHQSREEIRHKNPQRQDVKGGTVQGPAGQEVQGHQKAEITPTRQGRDRPAERDTSVPQ